MTEKILVIEDDQALHPVLGTIAEELGMLCDATTSGQSGLRMVREGTYRLVILDLDLPDLDGIEVCRKIRDIDIKLPVVILTGRNDEPSHILGLELGADDYVGKPFGIPELTARIRAVLRRAGNAGAPPTGENPSQIGALRFDPMRREFSLEGKPVELSKTEFDVLKYLFTKAGIAVSRDELVEEVWGYRCTGFDATVTTYLSRIRQKIEADPENPQYLTTLRGVGYRFVTAAEIDARATAAKPPALKT